MVVGVAMSDSRDAYEHFVEGHGLDDLVHVIDTDRELLAPRFDVIGQPAWVLVEAETGRSRTALGALGIDGMHALLEEGVDPAE